MANHYQMRSTCMTKLLVWTRVLLLCRLRLFRSINQHPTLYEVVTGKHRMSAAQPASRRKRAEQVRAPSPDHVPVLAAHSPACGCLHVRCVTRVRI